MREWPGSLPDWQSYIGRSAAAKDLDEKAVRLAVIAHLRHVETRYDELIARGYDRWYVRIQVEDEVHLILSEWEAAVRGTERLVPLMNSNEPGNEADRLTSLRFRSQLIRDVKPILVGTPKVLGLHKT